MRPRSVLIADDDPALTRVLTVRCRHLGLEVRHAADAMQALVMIHKDPPDLVIMDVTMPAGDGLSASQMLLSDPRLSRIPIIILSGRRVEDGRRRAEELGVPYVVKSPQCWSELKALICARLGLPPAAGEAAAQNADPWPEPRE